MNTLTSSDQQDRWADLWLFLAQFADSTKTTSHTGDHINVHAALINHAIRDGRERRRRRRPFSDGPLQSHSSLISSLTYCHLHIANILLPWATGSMAVCVYALQLCVADLCVMLCVVKQRYVQVDGAISPGVTHMLELLNANS